MPRDSVKSTSSPLIRTETALRAKRCRGTTRSGSPCRKWATAGTDYCRWHQDDTIHADEPKSAQTEIPSTLPGLTESQVHANEMNIQRRITAKKQRREAAVEREAIKAQQKAGAEAFTIAKSAQKLKESELAKSQVIQPIQPIGLVKLQTLEDCLGLIEYAVEEIIDLAPSLAKAKTLIAAARTSGQLIIQAGVADKAVEWFQENVKLVAGIDLDQL